jgi:hypothetical protein
VDRTGALLAPLQKAHLADDWQTGLFVVEMFHDLLAQVVADLVRVPLGEVQQSLHTPRISLADGLGELPAVRTALPSRLKVGGRSLASEQQKQRAIRR